MLYRHNVTIRTDWNLIFWDNSLYISWYNNVSHICLHTNINNKNCLYIFSFFFLLFFYLFFSFFFFLLFLCYIFCFCIKYESSNDYQFLRYFFFCAFSSSKNDIDTIHRTIIPQTFNTRWDNNQYLYLVYRIKRR